MVRTPLLSIPVILLVALMAGAAGAQNALPRYEPDPYWPKALPNHWMLGEVSGVAVDSHDHIWIIHRPRTLSDHDRYGADGKADCCVPAPAVIEFDQAGKVLQAWGGPGQGYEWPDNEHGIFVDSHDDVWVGGNGDKDAQILKFTNTGKFLLQIGHHGQSHGSNDTQNLGRPAGLAVWPATNELFVADGYANRRVIVFDAATGAYKRHWGAYGKKPDDAAPRTRVYDGPGSPQFNLVHGLRISNDGLLYVGDRVNNRIQVFHLDGTFVKEGYIERKTSAGEGTAFDVAFSPDKQQRFFYVPDGSNKKIQMVNRETLEITGFVGGSGGHGQSEFYHIHSIATDSKGNIYLGEVNNGRRALRWSYKGVSHP
ncbi:MAG TPA: hypothetical protein VK789_02295 [Bryobacteraceae bacterium]|nr:hypothetical protein [Bryobacteraceae bacterium]